MGTVKHPLSEEYEQVINEAGKKAVATTDDDDPLASIKALAFFAKWKIKEGRLSYRFNSDKVDKFGTIDRTKKWIEKKGYKAIKRPEAAGEKYPHPVHAISGNEYFFQKDGVTLRFDVDHDMRTPTVYLSIRKYTAGKTL